MGSSAWAAVWALVVSVIAAIVAAVSNLWVNRRTARLQSHLDFVNAQLRDFYGPLLATAEASEQAWVIFRDHYKSEPGSDLFWNPKNPPTREARAAYHHWVETIFMPLNEKMVEIISTRLDLIIQPELPQCLTDLYTYALTRKAALGTWVLDSEVPPDSPHFPTHELLPYLEVCFTALKREQARLLQAITATREYPLTQNLGSITFMSAEWNDARTRESSPAQDASDK
jgi:hypothetical protein